MQKVKEYTKQIMILTEHHKENNITRKLISRDNINSLRIDLKNQVIIFIETILMDVHISDTSHLSYQNLNIYQFLFCWYGNWDSMGWCKKNLEENTEYSYEHDGNVYTEYVSEIRTKFRTLIEWVTINSFWYMENNTKS
jgi:hypothetical protein